MGEPMNRPQRDGGTLALQGGEEVSRVDSLRMEM